MYGNIVWNEKFLYGRGVEECRKSGFWFVMMKN